MIATSRSARLATTLSAVAMASGLGVSATAAHAQAESEADVSAEGGIVVTARKRSEDIQKVPVTVVAVTSQQIEQKGIVSVADLSGSTPGININNSSSGNVSRSFQQIILRGFTSATTSATTTSMFIDGVPVASPSQLTSISNPERVEILKGPQAAYFGRSTFAGAINIVNKAPSSDWQGYVQGMVGTQDSYRYQGAIEGPIFGDLLTFRLTGDKYKRGGTYTNAFNGERLGTTSSKTATLTLEFKPAPNFTARVFGLLSEDNDGAPATARVNANYVSLSSSGSIVTGTTAPNSGTILQTGQSNCVLVGNTRGVEGFGTAINNPYICGVIPNAADPTSFNTTTTDSIRAALAAATGRVMDPTDGVSGYGLRRKTQHYHGTIDWEFSDALSLNVLGGYNRELWSTLLDLDGYDTSLITSTINPKGYFDFPFLVERKNNDWSIEGRLSLDAGPLRGVAGVSYLQSKSVAGGGGTFATFASTNFIPGDTQRNRTTGLFFGLTYELTSQLSASIEGRYQIDNIALITRPAGRNLSAVINGFVPAANYVGGSLLAERTYKNFTPRFIVNYQATPDLMVYGSVSRGVNPALSNVTILAQSAVVQAAALAAGGALLINPEKVTNFEVGVKGYAIDGRLRYALSAYYAQWRDQVNSLTIVVDDPASATGKSFVNVTANSGSTDLKGIEADLTFKVNDLITLDAAGAINDSSIKDYKSTTVSQLTGLFDYSGKEMKQTSKYSANVGIVFSGEIASMKDASWYVRTDWSYKSGFWTNEANVAKTRGRNVFNIRGSITKGPLTVDVFVNNIFNDRNPVSAADNFTFTPSFALTGISSAIQLGLPELRTAGVQAKVKF